MIKINFIGCGRVGKTLASLFIKNKIATIAGILNSSYQSSRVAAEFAGEGFSYSDISQLQPADIYFITTPDDVIESAYQKLVAANNIKKGAIILHCSGCLDSDIFKKPQQAHFYVASIHPIKSFANPAESVKTFPGTYCAIEGDKTILPDLVNLFEKIGAQVSIIDKNNKKIYHIGSVLANNYLVTLHYQALECYKKAGVPDETASRIVNMMMTETINNLKKLTHEKALTGPIQRGDTRTIQYHMDAMAKEPILRDMYKGLGHATLFLAKHPQNKTTALRKILSDHDKAEPEMSNKIEEKTNYSPSPLRAKL